MVGEDGNVYEGRGWSKIGAHTYGYNFNGIGKWWVSGLGLGLHKR